MLYFHQFPHNNCVNKVKLSISEIFSNNFLSFPKHYSNPYVERCLNWGTISLRNQKSQVLLYCLLPKHYTSVAFRDKFPKQVVLNSELLYLNLFPEVFHCRRSFSHSWKNHFISVFIVSMSEVITASKPNFFKAF